jgi:hypothetical protein
VIIGRTAQEKSFEILGLRFEDLVHHAYGGVELVDLDVAARTEKIAILYDLKDGIILPLELLVELLYLERVYCLVEVRQRVEVITTIVMVHC